MAAPTTFRCRGLRKWCSRRCESTTDLQPLGYPLVGFYCTLHTYQRPRTHGKAGGAAPGGDATDELMWESPQIEEHVRRRTSFVAPEATIAQQLIETPGLVKDRGSVPRCVAGLPLINWLKDRKGMSDEAAVAYAQRMVNLDILVPMTSDSRAFVPDSKAYYKVVVQPVSWAGRDWLRWAFVRP